MNTRCARCGEPAKGYAKIDNDRFCHGDDTPVTDPTCYEAEQQERVL